MRIRNKNVLVSKRHGIKTKLLVYEYKERFPSLNEEDLMNNLCLKKEFIRPLFYTGEIIVPSAMNKK